MLRWPNNQGVMGDDPPYLVVGTEVSAKYKGAFCEAKVRKVVRSVKCKVNFKLGLGTAVVTDDQMRGTLRVGSIVEVKHPDRKEYVEACIAKIQDCSQYTVVFDDGDITTLRRTALCLKSGRHFAESETLDQLPLTHPEHFGNPVVGSRRGGRRSRNPMSDESSDEEEEPRKGKLKEEKEADIGKVVCVELGDKKKQKDNWFPGLVVAPTAQEVVRIRVKDEYLVRSFKDGRYFTVPKKEATEFTREIGSKVDNNTLKTAVDKALQYLDKDELPPHWDRELLFGLDDGSTASDSDAAFESDSSDDEPREEKDHFVAQLYKFMDDRGTPINRGPAISGRDVDLYKLFKVVHKQGGYNRVTNHNQWKMVSHKLGFGQFSNTANLVKVAYKKYLQSFEDFYRKLGCTMVNHPRGNRSRHRGGRSLIRDKDRATPVNVPQGDGKDKGSDIVDDDDDQPEKGDDSAELSMDDKDEELGTHKEANTKAKDDIGIDFKRNIDKNVYDGLEKDERPQRPSRELKKDDKPPRKEERSSTLVTGRDPEVVTKLPVCPPPLERKLSDPQIKVNSSKGKAKRVSDGSVVKGSTDLKKRIVVTKVKGARAVGDEDDEMEELDVEDVEEEDEDKLTTTRSKSKEEFSRIKIDSRSNNIDSEKKLKAAESNERKIKPSLTATVEKRSGRPSLTAISEKKVKSVQDSDRKTVRSLAADFEKKSRAIEGDRKEPSSSDADKKSRSHAVGEGEKKIRPSLTATLERKKPSGIESDKKSRLGGIESDKKVRPSLTAELERKKVRPSLTADPLKKVSRLDSDKKKDSDRKNLRLSDCDKDDERKSKIHDSERKVNTPDSSKMSLIGDSDRKSTKSDSGDSEKRSNSKSNKKGEDDKRKLQVRKRKDNDESGGGAMDDSLDQLPRYKNVSVGDKLKVYYGPTHESKVTYEAKVLEVKGEGQEESYLVHYTGWNNRYDEWIKRTRIADNLSWSPARAKRRHQTQLSGLKKSSVKRRNLTPLRDGSSPLQKDSIQNMPSLPCLEKSRDSNPPRSSTPSSVTSSSSRTKSPAMRPSSARVTRNTIGEASQQLVEQITRRTRTRRISGQTDVQSESDSDGSESESEVEPSITRKSSRRLVTERDDDSNRKEVSSNKKKPRKRDIDMEVDEDIEKEGYKDEVKDDGKDEDDVSSESLSEDKAPLKRTRKGIRAIMERKVDIKSEVEDEEIPSSQSTKGRDFDLNQIRSELKGIDKSVKTSSPSGADSDRKSYLEVDPELDPEVDLIDLPDEKACTLMDPEESVIDMEDVYEFKEPEPFEFEVRTKREPSVERTGKLQKRPLPRIFDDIEKMEPYHKKKGTKSMGDSESSEEGSPSKKKFRRATGKKDDFEIKLEAKSPSPELCLERTSSSEQLTPPRKIFSSPTDDAFEKLRQSPSYRFSSGSPVRATTPTSLSLSSVPAPMQSPPQLSNTSPSVISVPPINRPTVTSSPNILLSSSVSKSVTVSPIKQVTQVQPLKIVTASTTPAPKHSIAQEPLAGIKQVQTSQSSNIASLSRPPVLAAAVKISDCAVISKAEDWIGNKPHITEKPGPSIEEQNIKTEKDESLPPLVLTSFGSPLHDRTSPEPPQLLPMFGPSPKALQESSKPEAKDVPMPQIKKETFSDAEPVCISNVRVGPSSGIAVRPKTPVLDEQPQDDIVEGDSPKRAGRRKAQIKRKKAVSKEFVEDSDTDSSDEGRRLIIDKSESSDSCSESNDTLKGNESKWSSSVKLEDSCLELQKNNSMKKDDLLSSKAKEPIPSCSSVSELISEEILSTVKIEEAEEPEVDGNICSLLCEETIPGSPAPPCDIPVDSHPESNSSRSSERPSENSKNLCKILEMPFASVPGNARSSGPSSSNSGSAPYVKASSHVEKIEPAAAELVLPKAGPSAVANEAAPVMDNTPPTTPDSTISTISNSPRGDHGDSLSILDNDSSKSNRDSEDADNKDNDFSDDDLDMGSRIKRLAALSDKKDNDRDKGRCDNDSATLSPASKKRRRSRKCSESDDRSKRPRHSTNRIPGRGAGSDSDDTLENSATVLPSVPSRSISPTQPSGLQHTSTSVPSVNSQTLAARSPRPSKYNFFVDLAPELDASQRIALLQQTLQELRKTYANVKQQLAGIDRRRKKLRRREREARLEARKMMREERKQAREELVTCS